MRWFRTARFIFLLSISSAISGGGQAQPQSTTGQEPPTLADIARQYQAKKQSKGPSQAEINRLSEGLNNAAEKQDDLRREGVSATSSSDEDIYQAQIKGLLAKRGFDQLDQAAQAARSTKARFAGGVWQLYSFYEALRTPTTPRAATQADWAAHLAVLKEWLATRPESITAPVALADAYISYAWKARGGGFADTVTEDRWGLMGDRVEMAKELLVKARSLKTRCPYWYEAMQHVALLEGWDKSAARALFDEAVSFEPHFYHYYREHVNFLLPKWYGEDGDAEEFANEVAARVDGQEGAFFYFELASVINCQCGSDEVHMARMSWPKIKQGYGALKQLYGTTSLKENRYAYMAYLAKDRPVAHDEFVKIGANWLPTVWKTRNAFETARLWAMSQ